MATTYKLIASSTVGSSGAAGITFSSIPQTYTDLLVLLSVRGDQSAVNSSFYIYLNGSSSNFTGKRVYGSGSSAASDSDTQVNLEGTGATATSNTFANVSVYIPNYTSTNAKSIFFDNVTENNATTAYALLGAGLWNPSTQAAINQIEFDAFSTQKFVQYSTAYLYGISNT